MSFFHYSTPAGGYFFAGVWVGIIRGKTAEIKWRIILIELPNSSEKIPWNHSNYIYGMRPKRSREGGSLLHQSATIGIFDNDGSEKNMFSSFWCTSCLAKGHIQNHRTCSPGGRGMSINIHNSIHSNAPPKHFGKLFTQDKQYRCEAWANAFCLQIVLGFWKRQDKKWRFVTLVFCWH